MAHTCQKSKNIHRAIYIPKFAFKWSLLFLKNETFIVHQIKLFTSKKIKINAAVQKYHVVVQHCQIGNFQSGTFAPMQGIEKIF